jgi:membrane protease YdiL (CAAX protease family)
MLEKLRAAEVWIFLGLIVLVNVAFISGIHSGILPERLYMLGRFALLGGTLAAVVFIFRGLAGVLELLRPMLVWRVFPGCLLFAVLWAPSLCILFLLGKSLLTGTHALVPSFETVAMPKIMLTVLIASFVGEIVWVSYAIGQLSKRFTTLVACLIVGSFWTAWWVPIVILQIGVIPDLPLGGLWISMLGVATICGFVYAKTRSGLVVLLMQFTFNSSLLVFPVTPSSGGIPTFWIFSAFYLCVAVLLHVIFGPRPLLRRSA